MVAAFGLDEPHGSRYESLFRRAFQEHWSLVTTWPCVVEAGYLLGPPRRFSFLRWVAAGAVAVYPFDAEELEPMVDLMSRYTESPRTQMDLADASLVWLAGETGVTRVMTTDERDFSRYRLPDGQAFEIL